VYLPKVRNVQKFQERYLDLATRDGIMQGIILMWENQASRAKSYVVYEI